VHHLAAGRDHLGGDQVVEGQAMVADLPADAAGQGQATDADALGVTRGDGQAVPSESRRDRTPGGTAADPHDVALLVDNRQVRQQHEVDHDSAVVRAEALEAVATAAHGQRQPRLGREADPRLHVRDARGPQDMGWATRREERPAHNVVRRLARFDDLPGEVTAEGFQWVVHCLPS